MFPQQVRQIGARSRRLREKEQRETNHSNDDADRQQHRRRDPSASPFAAIPGGGSFTLQPSAHQQRHRWNRRDGVIFLPRREAEEADNDHRPQEKQKICSLPARHLRPEFAPTPRNFLQRLRQKHCPRNEPQNQQRPEQQQRNRVVIARDTRIQKPVDMLIDEVEPEKSADVSLWWIAQRRQNMPRRGDGEKNNRARKQAHLQQVPQIPRQQQIKPDRRYREQQSD